MVNSVVIKTASATTEIAPQNNIYGACQPAEFEVALPSDKV